MKQSKKYRTIIIEPSEIIREGIKLLLEKHQSFQVTAYYSDIQSFEDTILKGEFQLILCNPAIIKFHKTSKPRDLFADYQNVCIVAILYQHVDTEILHGFDGILDIYDDGSVIPKKLIKIIETLQPANSQSADSVELSNREKDILIAVAKGLQNKEIADKLNISTHTVISHRKNIVRKTGIKTVSGLTLYALFNSLISQDEL
ncbi:MAG: response regulator transcription factor [Tannerella sp.]|jgi:DNA-binding NarL/FixJ family response regulator|nr:response regulator transcription factor [Tannerella sp.]